jgi:CII-binding regulator of phage lambda lysogenization HflD
MEEKRAIKNIAKKLINRKLYNKINSIKKEEEKFEVMKHTIISQLELMYLDIEKKINHFPKKGKDIFIPSMKFHLLKPKIKYFRATLEKKDLNVVLNLIKKINEGIENA